MPHAQVTLLRQINEDAFKHHKQLIKNIDNAAE